MTSLDPADIVPLRVLDGRPRNWRDAWGAGAAEGCISLVLNLAVLAGLVHLAFPQDRTAAEPRSISVEIVPRIPDPSHGEAKTTASNAGGDPTRPSAPAATSTSPKATPPPATLPAAALPTSPTREPPPPAPTPEPQPEISKPSPGPAEVAPQTADVDAVTSAPSVQVPASIDAGRDATPRLVEAPADPSQATTQSAKNQAANAETKPADSAKAVETPPAPQPEVLANPTPSTDEVAAPAATAEPSKPAPLASNEAKREADNTAKLAAALPFAQSFAPDMHRAALSGSGNGDVARYRGAVYGAFRKSENLVEQARARGLRGQTVIEFSVDEGGNLIGARVAVSSGNPAVDETAMAMIRQAAPYPPPPPGAQRTFSPAIRLGLDD